MTTLSLAKRLLREFIAPYKNTLGLALICMIVGALCTAVLPYSLKPVFDHVFVNGSMRTLVTVSLGILILFSVKGAAAYYEAIHMTYMGQKIICDIQKKLFDHLVHCDLSFFHAKTSGALLSHVIHDVVLMRNAMSTTLVGLGKDLFSLVFLSALMIYMDKTLAFLSFVVFPIAVFPILKMGMKTRKVTHKTQNEQAYFTTQLSQIFQSIRIVKAYNREDGESERVRTSIDALFQLIYRAAKIKATSHPIMETLGGIAIVGVIAYGGYQVIHHYRTAGDFMAFIAALLLVYEPLKRISHLNAVLQEGLSAAQRVFSLLDLKPTITVLSPHKTLSDVTSATLSFEGVCFSYTTSDGHLHDDKTEAHHESDDIGVETLSDISFSVKPGEKVAFVGRSGAGKSTLINLIPRFYDVTKGVIRFNDKDIRHIPFAELRAHMALVSQEIALFDRTVAENIAYSATEYTMDRIIAAAKGAAAHDFIMQLPKGYETPLGENGMILSGGQRQRIAIARALLKNAPLLLLDEATSALDSESEDHIQKALDHLSQGRTTISVAHRLSTIKDSDVIYVLDKGAIVARGTHDDLLAQGGIYADLWEKQSRDT